MSSSTSDVQLSMIIPRLFACGMTSAAPVSEIDDNYGMDAMCSLLSESGRFYKNTERIVNAAKYFQQKYNGTIPPDLTIFELTTLIGNGYKTACIFLEAAFDRVDGIPADIHVSKHKKKKKKAFTMDYIDNNFVLSCLHQMPYGRGGSDEEGTGSDGEAMNTSRAGKFFFCQSKDQYRCICRMNTPLAGLPSSSQNPSQLQSVK